MHFAHNKGVVDGLLLNNLGEYLFSPPSVHCKKIEANELCPCGSGMKLKR